MNDSDFTNYTDLFTNTTETDMPGYWAARVGFNAIGGTAIAIFGLIGNVISIIVLMNYKQKSSTPLLLTFLAVFDTIFLFFELFLEQLTMLSKFGLITAAYRPFITPIYVLFIAVPRIAFTGTMTMTILITIERFVAVVHPLRAARLCCKSMARKAIVCVFIWAVVFNIPRYLAYTTYEKFDPKTNTTRTKFIRTKFGESNLYNDIFIIWITFTLEFLIPFIIILALNAQLLLAIRRSRAFAPKSQKEKKSGGRLNAMVLAVTTMFFLCGMMSASALILARGVNKYEDCSVACNNYIAVADTMLIINSSVNIILYCVVGKQFRTIFMNVFCSRRRSTSYPLSVKSNTKTTSFSG
ncbi:FMRFamide receptor [Patella vulgata]|uniref:FMRFamide receptor n=1 Tax=Patella vulgata TaxID=6465 RepID=UPI0024A8BB28|nr:FMRFamide receptor [Patella vulgata]